VGRAQGAAGAIREQQPNAALGPGALGNRLCEVGDASKRRSSAASAKKAAPVRTGAASHSGRASRQPRRTRYMARWSQRSIMGVLHTAARKRRTARLGLCLAGETGKRRRSAA
jgi:hypothetical protein